MPKIWPQGWNFATAQHPSELVKGDCVPLYTEVDEDHASCDNCGSISGILYSFVIGPKGRGVSKWFPTSGNKGEMQYGKTESAPCPVCRTDAALRALRDRSGLVDMELEGKEALNLRLGTTTPKPGQKDAWKVGVTILNELPMPKTSALFFGGNGTGKTHLLVCLINACLAHSIQGYYATAEQLLSRLKATYDPESRSETTEAVRALLQNVAGLAVDEFEKVKWSSWAGEILFAIVEHRHRFGRATWFASNSTPDQLKEAHQFGASIVSRMESGFTVPMIGEDIRAGMPYKEE